MPDAKDTEIHDLRNSLMSAQNEMLLFRMDVFRVYESLRELLNRYPERTTEAKTRTAGGGNA